MSLKNKTTPFQNIDYKTEVNAELTSGRELNALLLIHGYIEAYLREWLFIVGKSSKDKLKKTIIEETGRINFKNVLLIHAILGNVDVILYEKTSEINRVRNDLAHDIITIDMNDEKTKKKIRKFVTVGIQVCDEIFKLYKQSLDKKAGLLVGFETTPAAHLADRPNKL